MFSLRPSCKVISEPVLVETYSHHANIFRVYFISYSSLGVTTDKALEDVGGKVECPISGHDIMEILNIGSGPIIATIKNELIAMVERGELTYYDRDKAKELVMSIYSKIKE